MKTKCAENRPNENNTQNKWLVVVRFVLWIFAIHSNLVLSRFVLSFVLLWGRNNIKLNGPIVRLWVFPTHSVQSNCWPFIHPFNSCQFTKVINFACSYIIKRNHKCSILLPGIGGVRLVFTFFIPVKTISINRSSGCMLWWSNMSSPSTAINKLFVLFARRHT